MIAGGLLKKEGVWEVFDKSDPSKFSLVKNDLAIFNGFIGEDNLMHLQFESVFKISLPTEVNATDSYSALLHCRLSHPSDTYLKIKLENRCVSGCGGGKMENVKCDTCMLAKSTKIPHNKTRPRAHKFLDNVHVDLSGIVCTEGLHRESYYMLFTDKYLSHRHIFPLASKTKEEVFDISKSYIAVSERQTECSLKQFTLGRGGEFVNEMLFSEMKRMHRIIYYFQ